MGNDEHGKDSTVHLTPRASFYHQKQLDDKVMVLVGGIQG